MSDATLRLDERTWLQGQLSTHEYSSRLRRSQPEHPFATLSTLDAEAIRCAAGIYHVTSSFMDIQESTAFHLDDEPEIFSVDFEGPLSKDPALQCHIDYLSSCSLTIGISWTPRDGYNPKNTLDLITQEFTHHATVRARAVVVPTDLTELANRVFLSSVYLLDGDCSLNERLAAYERGLPRPKAPSLVDRLLGWVGYRRAA